MPPDSIAERETPQSFGERLAEQVRRRQSQLVLGLDPDPARLWPRAIELSGGAGDKPAPPAERAALAVVAHCTLAIAAAGEHCVAVKPQVACFERLGPPGWAALGEVVKHARDAGLLVIADAKRGDIDISATAYAQAFFSETPTVFGPVPGLGADAMTVNPLQGASTLQAFIDQARPRGGGLFALVRTSNAGAGAVQDLELTVGGTVSDQLARMVDELGASGPSGISDVGAVVGATVPEHLERLRSLMPRTPFLLPGVGPQGGRVEDLAAAFAPGPAGGLVSASRGIVNAYERDGGDPEAAARREAERLRELAWRLAS
jgi:orotidine-5'-phosphate decarboxylase